MYLENKEDTERWFRTKLDWQNKKEMFAKLKDFEGILQFLLFIQSVYYPYAKSGGKRIQISGDDKKWQEKKNKFDSKKALELLQLTIEEVVKWYKIFSDKARNLLGIKRDDWIQLWKNISWSKKDNLEGEIRLGIEYLQWVIMLKRFIEEYRQEEILDIDEISNISADEILKFDPLKMSRNRLLRSLRNEWYFDSKSGKNYYYDKYKRLFYLANSFGLDYQPRVMVFVEGETEERILPKVFEWCFDKPENIGIEIVNFKGVDKLLSTSENAAKLRNLLIDLQKLDDSFHQERVW